MNAAPLTCSVAAAFSQVLAIAGVPLAGPNGKSCKCLSGPLAESKAVRDSGLWAELNSTAEMFTTDFVRLAIADRSEVQLGGKALLVMVIETHPLAPTTKIHLKPAH